MDPLTTAATYAQIIDAKTAIPTLTGFKFNLWWLSNKSKSKINAAGAKPNTGSGPPANTTITEPIVPTKEAVPYCPVVHATRSNVTKMIALWIVGRCVSVKPRGATVKFSATHKALKMPIKAMLVVANRVFFVCSPNMQ